MRQGVEGEMGKREECRVGRGVMGWRVVELYYIRLYLHCERNNKTALDLIILILRNLLDINIFWFSS